MGSNDYELSICTDCAMLVANGQTPEAMDEYSTEEYLAAIETIWPECEGWVFAVGNDGAEFSRNDCDMCGRPLAGARHDAVAWRQEGDDDDA